MPAGPAVTLEAAQVHDFAQVFIDGVRAGFMDRRKRSYTLPLPERKSPDRLDILVEAMGRVNFGQEVLDRKGLSGPIRLIRPMEQATELLDWAVYPLPLDSAMLGRLHYSPAKASGPAFWRATLQIEIHGDTFLDMRHWGKGVVWINGHCLGRFWNIGPTQTMYIPGPWLKRGRNEVIILDLLGPDQPVVAGLAEPILDQLRPGLDFMRVRRPAVQLALDSEHPTFTGQFRPGADLQEITFPHQTSGRYFCLESLSAHDDKPYAAIAELDLLDESGKPLSHEGWTIAYVDSEERDREDGAPQNAIDAQRADSWHPQRAKAPPQHPRR